MIYSLTTGLTTGDWISSWYETDNYETPFQKASVSIDYSNVTGTTLDGKIYVEISPDIDDDDFITIAGSIDIDKAATADDDEILQVEYVARAIRLRYDAGNVQSGDLLAKIILQK